MQQLHETSMTDMVTQTLRSLPAVGGMAVVTGPNGVGKTWAVRVAQQSVNRICMVNPTPAPAGGGSPRGFYRDVARGMGLQVENNMGAADLVQAIKHEIVDRGRLLVLDHTEYLFNRQMEFIRHLVDECGFLVMVGGDHTRQQVTKNPALATRTRLPVELSTLGLMDLQKIYGDEFAPDALREIQQQAHGLWAVVATLTAVSRQVCTARQRPTQEFTPSDVAATAQTFLLARQAAA